MEAQKGLWVMCSKPYLKHLGSVLSWTFMVLIEERPHSLVKHLCMGGSTPKCETWFFQGRNYFGFGSTWTEADKVTSCQDQTTSSSVDLEAGEIGPDMNSGVLLYWTSDLKAHCMLSKNLEHCLIARKKPVVLSIISGMWRKEKQRSWEENRTVLNNYFLAPLYKCECEHVIEKRPLIVVFLKFVMFDFYDSDVLAFLTSR